GCSENYLLGGLLGLQSYLMAPLLQALAQLPRAPLRLPALQVVLAQLPVADLALQDVVEDPQQRVPQGEPGALAAAPLRPPPIRRRQRRVPRVARRPRRRHPRPPQPAAPLRGAAAAAL